MTTSVYSKVDKKAMADTRWTYKCGPNKEYRVFTDESPFSKLAVNKSKTAALLCSGKASQIDAWKKMFSSKDDDAEIKFLKFFDDMIRLEESKKTQKESVTVSLMIIDVIE
jgi:hypothetical protein